MLNKYRNIIRSIVHKINFIYKESKQNDFNLKKYFLEYCLLHDKGYGIDENNDLKEQIIISLTSHGKRLEEVWLTIESLMQQTFKANKIILWLDKEVSLELLPYTLKLQEKRGLIIKKYLPDIRSYKKLIPTLKEYPEATIITVDDDLIYDFNFIEKLIRMHKSHPTEILAARTHVMTFDNEGNLKNYNEWKKCCSETSNPKHLFLTGVGGVLYPPYSLDPEVLNEDIFTKICPSADDVWFTAMALKKGTPILKVKTRTDSGDDYIMNDEVQDIGLWNINTGTNAMNDPQIKKVFSNYNIFSIIKEK